MRPKNNIYWENVIKISYSAGIVTFLRVKLSGLQINVICIHYCHGILEGIILNHQRAIQRIHYKFTLSHCRMCPWTSNVNCSVVILICGRFQRAKLIIFPNYQSHVVFLLRLYFSWSKVGYPNIIGLEKTPRKSMI